VHQRDAEREHTEMLQIRAPRDVATPFDGS
jgi:hypothetical protein